MANAVFLCGECGNYFSTINDIRSHSCWANAKAASTGENNTEDVTTLAAVAEADENAPENSQLVAVEEASLDASLALSLDDSYIKSACYAYVDEGKWTDDAIKLLIQLYKEKEADFRNPDKKRREVWELIAAEINKEGYLFTTDQVDTKWRNLKKAYWRSKEAQCEIGAPSKFIYEELLDEVYGHILPKRLQVSRVIPRVIRRTFVGSDYAVAEGMNSGMTYKRPYEGGNRPGPKKRIVRDVQLSSDTAQEIVNVLEHMRADKQEAEEERRRMEENHYKLLLQMHEEKMNVLKDIVQAVETLSKQPQFSG